MTDADGVQRSFDSSGRLTSVRTRSGQEQTFHYSAGRLVRIMDASGRKVTLSYDPSGRISNVIDPLGRIWAYGYDGLGRLVRVDRPATGSQPQGSTQRYVYDSGQTEPRLQDNLTAIVDGRGLAMLVNDYDLEDRVVRQHRGAFASSITYAGPTTTVIDLAGNETRWSHDAQGRAIAREERTNRNVRPKEGDYLTTYAFNGDGERTRTTFPAGNAVEWSWDESNPSPQARGNLLQVRRIDPQGAILSRAWGWEPQANRPAWAQDELGSLTRYRYDCEEAELGDLNGNGVIDPCFGRLVRIERPTPKSCGGDPVVETLTWDEEGRLERHVDPAGIWTDFEYDQALDAPTRVVRDSAPGVDPGTGERHVRQTTRYDYDAVGQVVAVVDPVGNQYDLVSDAMGNLEEVALESLGYRVRMSYDADGRLIERRIRNLDGSLNVVEALPEVRTAWTYDALGRLVAVSRDVDASTAVTTTFEYDALGNVTTVRSPLGNELSFSRDERGLLVSETRGGNDPASARTVTYDWDANRNLIRTTNGLGQSTTLQYDGFDRSVGRIEPVRTISVERDPRGLPTRVVLRGSPDGTSGPVDLARRHFTYDELGRLCRAEEEIFDRLTGAVLPDGPASPGDGLITTAFAYDSRGNLLARTDDAGTRIEFAWDGLSRLRQRTDPLGNRIEYRWNDDDTVEHLIELARSPEGLVPDRQWTTRFDRDALGRTTRRIAPGGFATSFEYDSRSNLLQVQTPDGTRTDFEYDGLNRRIRSIHDWRDPSGATRGSVVVEHGYDADGRLARLVDGNGNVTRYEYDATHRRTDIVNPDGTRWTWAYDAAGRAATSTDPNGSRLDYTRDAAGRLIGIDVAPGSGVAGTEQQVLVWDGADGLVYGLDAGDPSDPGDDVVLTRRLDSRGRRLEEGSNGAIARYQYVGIEGPTRLTYPDGTSLDLSFDPLHRLKGIAGVDVYRYLGSDRVLEEEGLTGSLVQSDFDPGTGRLSRVRHFAPAGAMVDELAYEYNGRGQVIRQTRRFGTEQDRLDRDSRGHIVSGTLNASGPGGGTGFSNQFDAAGNLIERNLGGAVTRYAHDSRNRIQWEDSGSGPVTYTYDAVGNRRSGPGGASVWDAFGRVVRHTGVGSDVRYTYDPLNRLHRRTDDASQQVEVHRWNGAALLQVDGTAASRRLVWGHGPLHQIIGAEAYTLLRDGRGSTRTTLDQLGGVVETARYDDLGVPILIDGQGGALGTESVIGNRLLQSGFSLWMPESGSYASPRGSRHAGTAAWSSGGPALAGRSNPHAGSGYNEDGRVSGADFLVWQRSAASADYVPWREQLGPPPQRSAGGVDIYDFDTWGDSFESAGAYLTWKTNYGNTAQASRGERGISGVTIYADLNRNGQAPDLPGLTGNGSLPVPMLLPAIQAARETGRRRGRSGTARQLPGGSGNDILLGGATTWDQAAFGDLGNDWLVGGTGRDAARGTDDMGVTLNFEKHKVSYSGGWGNDWLVGGTGRDSSGATGGNDAATDDMSMTLNFEEARYGGWGNDLLNADDVMTVTRAARIDPYRNFNFQVSFGADAAADPYRNFNFVIKFGSDPVAASGACRNNLRQLAIAMH